MASSSEVFLCSGDDLPVKSLTLHLYKALDRLSIKAFIYDGRDTGEDITQVLMQIIQRSKISVIVFSKEFDSSTFCLDQVTKIMECCETFGQIVIPILFDVYPSDVETQSGSFEENFARHETDCNPVRVQTWKSALSKAATMPGWDLNNTWGDVDAIVQDIRKKLISGISYLEGLENEEWFTLFISFILEASSALSEQLKLALMAMILAIIGLLFCMGFLAHKAQKETVHWEQKGSFLWFYSHHPKYKAFGTTIDYFQLVVAIWQCFNSGMGYSFARLVHKQNPIKMSVTLLLLCLCLLVSILVKKYSRRPLSRTNVV